MTKVLKDKYEFEKGVPVIPANASSRKNKTGAWRLYTPEIDYSRCIKCRTCYVYCPHGAIDWVKGRPVINYTFCKGCMICGDNCPVKCISNKGVKK